MRVELPLNASLKTCSLAYVHENKTVTSHFSTKYVDFGTPGKDIQVIQP